MTEAMLLSGMNVQVYAAHYIGRAGWWLDKNGRNWWNRKDKFAHNAIYLLTEGEFNLTVNGTCHHITAGQLIFIPAGSELIYDFNGHGPLCKYYIHFDMTFSGRALGDCFTIPTVFRPRDNEALISLLARARDLFEGIPSPTRQIALQGVALSLISAMLEECRAPLCLGEQMDEGMRRALARMQEVGDEPSVASLAKLAGYSVAHFSKKFKQTFGCSPSAYMAKSRVAQAEYLLQSTTMPVSAIASRLGFADAGYFSHFFCRHTGLYPSAYRKEK